MYYPDFETFVAHARHGNVVPVYRQLLSDTLTPVSAFTAFADSPHAFLLESVIGGEKIARHSFLAADPFVVFRAAGRHVTVTRYGSRPDPADGWVQVCGQNMPPAWQLARDEADPLAALEALLKPYRAVHIGSALPRFTGGAVGFASYDTVRYWEGTLGDGPPDDRNLPDMLFGLYDSMVIFDHVNKTILALHNAIIADSTTPPTTGALRAIYTAACRAVDGIVARLARPVTGPITDIDLGGGTPPGELAAEQIDQLEKAANFTRENYLAAVGRALDYIAAGDIFQVVPSQRFAIATPAAPLDIYRALRVVNPSPFMFLLSSPEGHLVGSSPEILCRVEDAVITNRPLAGTRRRGRDDAEDRRLASELLADPKDRAEHIMLVDLGRNDVGRVANYGTVRLDEVMVVERYSHVMHLCSNVSGRLRPGLTAFDALRAALPVGTVSGAPKVRAMQIIDELEPTRRGPYGGAVGYIDFSGNMDTCIALRTLVVKGGVAHIQVGGGVVADSQPADEYQETINKARAMLRAIQLAEAMTPAAALQSAE